jgi:putative membrane protein
MSDSQSGKSRSEWIDDDASTELASNRTSMSFQRTRMSADRTLMSIMRTSLSLISFGFTIFQFFRHIAEMDTTVPHVTTDSARNFGMALVYLGELLLLLGIWKHVSYMLQLRRDHARLVNDKLLHTQGEFPFSVTLMTSLALLAIGLTAIVGMLTRSGPLG